MKPFTLHVQEIQKKIGHSSSLGGRLISYWTWPEPIRLSSIACTSQIPWHEWRSMNSSSYTGIKQRRDTLAFYRFLYRIPSYWSASCAFTMWDLNLGIGSTQHGVGWVAVAYDKDFVTGRRGRRGGGMFSPVDAPDTPTKSTPSTRVRMSMLLQPPTKKAFMMLSSM